MFHAIKLSILNNNSHIFLFSLLLVIYYYIFIKLSFKTLQVHYVLEGRWINICIISIWILQRISILDFHPLYYQIFTPRISFIEQHPFYILQYL
jgi:hypothetical protein